MYMHRKQNGSAHAIVIVILVIALMGALGVVFYQNFIAKSVGRKTADNAQDTPAKADVTKDVAKTKYLTIKEWGVKVPLTDTISDATIDSTYSFEGADGKITEVVQLRTKKYDNVIDCAHTTASACISYVTSTVSRGHAGANYYNGPDEPVKFEKIGSKFGDYYYVYQAPETEGVSESHLATIADASAAFEAAFKKIQAQ